MRAHAAHHRFEKSAETATAVRSALVPSKDLQADAPEVLEKLEALDDAVYDAILGQAAALGRLRALWPAALVASPASRSWPSRGSNTSAMR